MSELVLPSKLGGMLASGRRILVTADRETELAQFLGAAAAFTPPGNPEGIVRALTAMIETPDDAAVLRQAKARELDAAVLLPAFERSLASH